MKLQKGLVTGAFAVVLAGANANAQTASQPNASLPTTTASVSADVPVRALVSAMQAQDAAAIRAQFAPTATQAYGANGKMKDPAATAKWLESDIIKRRGKVEDPEFTVNGNEVMVRGQYNAVGYTSKANFLFTVENGLITSGGCDTDLGPTSKPSRLSLLSASSIKSPTETRSNPCTLQWF